MIMANVSLKLINYRMVPPSGYRFKYLWDGQVRWSVTENNSLDACVAEAQKFFQDNKMEIPENFARKIEQDLCEVLGPQWCMEFTPQEPIFYPRDFSVSSVIQGGKTLVHHYARAIKEGTTKLVSDEEVKRRASICATGEGGARCRKNVPLYDPECKPCTAQIIKKELDDMSKSLTKCPETPYDSKLGACSVCACPLRSKICVPSDIILSHMPYSQQLKLPEFCWLKT